MSFACKLCKQVLRLSELEMAADENSSDVYCSKCQSSQGSDQDNRKRVESSFTSAAASSSTTRSVSTEARSHAMNERRNEIEKKRVTFEISKQEEEIDPFAFPSGHTVEDVSAEQEAKRLEFIEAQKKLFQQQELEVPVVRSLSKSAERAALDLVIDNSSPHLQKGSTTTAAEIDDVQDEVDVDPFAFSSDHAVEDVSAEQEAKRLEFIEAQKKLFEQQEQEVPVVRSLSKSAEFPALDLVIDNSPQVSQKSPPISEAKLPPQSADTLEAHLQLASKPEPHDDDPFAFPSGHTVEDVSAEQEAKRLEFIEAQKKLFEQQEVNMLAERTISKSSTVSFDGALELANGASLADLIIDESPIHTSRGANPTIEASALPSVPTTLVETLTPPVVEPSSATVTIDPQQQPQPQQQQQSQQKQWARESWFDASKWASAEVNTGVNIAPANVPASDNHLNPPIDLLTTEPPMMPASSAMPTTVQNSVDPSFAWPEELAEPSMSKHSSLSSAEWPGTIKSPEEIAEAERIAAELRAWEEQADRELEAEARKNEQLEQELRQMRDKQSDPLVAPAPAASHGGDAALDEITGGPRVVSSGSQSSASNSLPPSVVRPFSTSTVRSQNSLESDSAASSAANTPTKGKGASTAASQADDGIVHGSQMKLVPVSSFDDRERQDSQISPLQKKGSIKQLLSGLFSTRKSPHP